jgi:hypothetical protein
MKAFACPGLKVEEGGRIDDHAAGGVFARLKNVLRSRAK